MPSKEETNKITLKEQLKKSIGKIDAWSSAPMYQQAVHECEQICIKEQIKLLEEVIVDNNNTIADSARNKLSQLKAQVKP